jgi:cysteinyl-tRNA synthetase
MVSHIEKLIDNGHAYALEDGHVLFHVPSWEDYGRFANKDREEQISGARVEIASHKRDPADFVLWKPSDSETPGWPSPWCEKGRPGWHIECSAMSEKFLGKDFDIHGGGIDLVFPHHQNEIAQSCCVHPPEERKDRYARYWMHNGYLMSEGEKMSKSLGNFYTVSQLLEEFPGEALRLVLLQTHYRQPLDFSRQKCRDARASLDRLYRLKQDLPEVEEVIYDAPFMAALADDLNTPLALARLHELADDTHSEHGVAAFKGALSLLGLAQKDAKVWFKGADDMEGISSVEIDSLISERQAAKQAKDFATADQIRNSLKDQGVILEDKPGGLTEWRRA